MLVERCNILSFLKAICWILGGDFFEISRLNILSVSLHLKLLITLLWYTALRLTASVKFNPNWAKRFGRKDVALELILGTAHGAALFTKMFFRLQHLGQRDEISLP